MWRNYIVLIVNQAAMAAVLYCGVRNCEGNRWRDRMKAWGQKIREKKKQSKISNEEGYGDYIIYGCGVLGQLGILSERSKAG